MPPATSRPFAELQQECQQAYKPLTDLEKKCQDQVRSLLTAKQKAAWADDQAKLWAPYMVKDDGTPATLPKK